MPAHVSHATDHAENAIGLATNLRKLNALARRDPRAVAGVVQFWLGPKEGESEPRADE